MNLKTYMKKYKIRQKKLGSVLHLTQAAISHKFKGRRKWTADQALAIEKYTKGMVSRMEILYPNER